MNRAQTQLSFGLFVLMFAACGATTEARCDETGNPHCRSLESDAGPSDAGPNPDAGSSADAGAGPAISAVSAIDLSTVTATITWTLNEPATGQVDYGTTTAYGQQSVREPSFQYSVHRQALSGLMPQTTYHYRVRSSNRGGVESVSSDFTFTTRATGGPTTHAPPPTSTLVVNVKNTGATGNGSTDDTAAIQAAINQVGGTGGTVLVPAGTYMVNALQGSSASLKSNMTFKMEPGAVLKAITNSSEIYDVLRISGVSNVNVIGGTIQGERNTHTGKSCFPLGPLCGSSSIPGSTTGMTGQWGSGIGLYVSHDVFIESVTAIDCWGDGFQIYDHGSSVSTNITFSGVVANNNRRQGLSVTAGNGIFILDSVFKNTHGTQPECGLDVEPDSGASVNNVQVLNSEFSGNASCGISLFGDPTSAPITNALVNGSRVYGGAGGFGITIAGTNNSRVTNNTVGSIWYGIDFRNGATGNVVTGNTVCAPNPVGVDTSGGGTPSATVAANTVTGNTTSTAGCKVSP